MKYLQIYVKKFKTIILNNKMFENVIKISDVNFALYFKSKSYIMIIVLSWNYD